MYIQIPVKEVGWKIAVWILLAEVRDQEGFSLVHDNGAF
jgi:hypothetical protein